MIVAEKKKKEHVVEYILYMLQLHDLIRALNHDMNKINETIISQYPVPENKKKEIENWYSNLLIRMNQEGVKNKGYLSFIDNLITELNNLHLGLLKNKSNTDYLQAYNNAKDNIIAYKSKSNLKSDNEVKICIMALYNLLLLSLKKTKINPETKEAMASFGQLMTLLTKHYHGLL